MEPRKPLARTMLALSALAAGVAPAAPARADQSIIRNPGQATIRSFELEPHGTLAWRNYYAPGAFSDVGLGPGFRASIVLSPHAFVRTINNSVAITFGADLLFYGGCYWRYYPDYAGYNGGCNTTQLYFPIALQWNFFLSQRWSVFAELGGGLYVLFFDDPCNQGFACDPRFYRGPSHFGVDPVIGFLGGRYHFNDHVALTMRLGYPYTSVGVSFY
jgi:hypothetical protein